MVYLIKAMIIFITILPLSIVFKSEPVLNIFQDVLDYLVIEFFVLIILIIIFGPLAIYFTKKDLEEHYNLNQAVIFNNVDLLTQILQMYEQHIPKSEQIKRRTIVTYYKALILLNTGKYNEMITEVTRVLKSYYGFFAIKYEFYNLLGRAYQKLDYNTKSRENFIKCMKGFKKLYFYEPVHQIEKILQELPIV